MVPNRLKPLGDLKGEAMSWLRDGRRLVLLGAFGLLCGPWVADAAARRRAAQGEPAVLHKAIECWPRDEFLLLRAAFQPGLEVMGAKVYFRSDKYPDFYYVNLQLEPTGGGQAVMPKPSAETESIIYYLEMVTRSYSSARNEEHNPPVTESGECRRRDPLAAWFTGDSPNIVVGATRIGAAAIPPGFEATGITGFINAAGVAAGAGGGLGAAPVIVALGAAGATAGVIAASQGSGGGATTSVAAATTSVTTTSTPTVTTVPVNPPPLACYTTTPNPPVIQEGEAVRFDASCSKADNALRADVITNYRWEFLGTGKVVEGPDKRVVSTLYNDSGIYEVRLTVQDEGGGESSTRGGVTVQEPPSTTTTAASTSSTTTSIIDGSTSSTTSSSTSSSSSSTTTTAGPAADLAVTKRASADPVKAGASLDYVVTVTNLTGSTATGVKMVDTLPVGYQFSDTAGASCTLTGITVTCDLGTLDVGKQVNITIFGSAPTAVGSITNRASVSGNEPDPDLKNNDFSLMTQVNLRAEPLEPTALATTFTSFLGVGPFDGSSRGEVRLNDATLAVTDSSAPFDHRLSGRAGENGVEAHLTSEAGASGFWRFDFSGAPHFVAGSIRVETGEVISLDAYTVVFGVSGRAGGRIKFRYRLQP